MKKLTILLILSISLIMINSCKKVADSELERDASGKSTTEEYADESKAIDAKPAGIHNFTAEDLYSVRRVGDPQVSPDGKWVLFSLGTPSIADNKIYKDIYVVSIDGKDIKRLTSDKASDYNARWSPDGKKIAFISTREETPQIFVMEYPDGSPKKITDIENGVANLAWSPDGKYFSFTSDVKIKETVADKYPKYPEANVRIYENVPVRHWDEWVDESFSHLFIIPTSGGEAKDLMKDEPYDAPLKPFGGGEEIAWSNDSKEITYTCKKLEGKDFVETTNSDLYKVNIETGETKNITEGMMGFDKAPLYSNDGKWIAFTSQERAGFESDRIRLMLYNRETEEIKELTKTLDQWVFEFIWAPDSKSLYFSATDSGTIQLFNINAENGEWKTITEGWYNHGHGLGITNDGKKLIFGRENMQTPSEIFAMNLDNNEITQLTNENEEIMKNCKPVTCKERWVDADDGKKIQCWVLYPPDFDENKKYPMISYCQGGPQSMIGQRFHFRWNYYLMASNGYVVLLPNRRGLPGFGQDWNDAISGDWGGMPMRDILAATDEMAKEPYVDEEGLCAVGASAGGYATFWLAGNHEGRFKAFISHCGVFNMVSMYGSTEELWFPNWENGGPYWVEKNKPFYKKHSPHEYAQNWDTPILISTGEYDFRVPYTQSLEAFTVAQVKGIPSKLIVYPEETHFIAHAQEFIIWSNEFFGFLDKYTKK